MQIKKHKTQGAYEELLMETPNNDKKQKSEIPPASRTPNISLPRKILIGLFILGFWIFFYWFREP